VQPRTGTHFVIVPANAGDRVGLIGWTQTLLALAGVAFVGMVVLNLAALLARR
jgi:hypothetical protein